VQGNQDTSEGRVRYFREVEVKHGRVAMLAAVGFIVGEKFHPLFGGDIDVPSYVAFQATPLQTFWPSVVATIGVFEFFSIAQIEGGFEVKDTFPSGEKREAGDYMFDPLGLKPKDAAELKIMQEKEINNGRLAMIAVAGMVAQELVSGEKL
jgi:light-harvesting complex I chlorophyll a/b binding protein 4